MLRIQAITSTVGLSGQVRNLAMPAVSFYGKLWCVFSVAMNFPRPTVSKIFATRWSMMPAVRCLYCSETAPHGQYIAQYRNLFRHGTKIIYQSVPGAGRLLRRADHGHIVYTFNAGCGKHCRRQREPLRFLHAEKPGCRFVSQGFRRTAGGVTQNAGGAYAAGL
ncbi:hypothetical protein SODG_006643 [Sodalis praecaptivus]|nr:hypothetical protein NVIRENTERO_03186 [Sodalis praecaptivus]